MTLVTLAVEDVVTESVVFRAIEQARLDIDIEQSLQKRGKPYIRSRVDSLNRSAHGGVCCIVLIDSDNPETCPVDMERLWFPAGRSPRLVFRVISPEVESWLHADAEGLSEYLGVPQGRIAQLPDSLLDAKRALVDLARGCGKAERKRAMVPRTDALSVGPGYNGALLEFIQSVWSLQRARRRSPSLDSFVSRVALLAQHEK